jgi:hypothetical protein
LLTAREELKREFKKDKRFYVDTLQARRATVFERGLLLGAGLGQRGVILYRE